MATSGIHTDVINFMREELKEYPAKEFRPCAFYDKHLDCIRVQLVDCSFFERRLNRFFTVLIRNDSTDYVGLTIKGVRHLFETLGLPKKGPILVAEIIDAIVSAYPDEAAQTIKSEFGAKLTRGMSVDGIEELPRAA